MYVSTSIIPIYPNNYVLLMGPPAARKSTALKYARNLLKKAGYKRMAPERMSRQAFINEMHAINQPEALGLGLEDILDMETDYPYEMSIAASEFVDFIGQHDKDYLMLLTTLWDNEDEYSNPKISKTSIKVIKPTVNLISAATPLNLEQAFPSGSMDTGTLSRFIFVHGEPSGKKILFPPPPDKEAERALVSRLTQIGQLSGPMTFTPAAIEAMQWIYENAKGPDDPRFTYYEGRRNTHLVKLCIIMAASDLRLEINEHDVLAANTILGMTEYNMPHALGDFGRSRQSSVIHNILQWLKNQSRPVKIMEIFQQFASDFNSEKEFQSMMMDLQATNKIVAIHKKKEFLGVMVRERSFPTWLKPLMKLDMLTPEERDMLAIG